MIKIDDRVIIRDEHDHIAAACGHNPAGYGSLKIRRYTVETGTMGFSFSVGEDGVVVHVSDPQQLVEGVDIL